MPIGASFWAKLDGSVDAGFTYTRSSGIAQTTLNSDTVFRRPAFRFGDVVRHADQGKRRRRT